MRTGKPHNFSTPFIRFVSFFTEFTWISEPIFWELNFAVSIKPTPQSPHNLSFAI
nr:MAG TPA: Nrap protein PAP/OAS1-like domain 5 [Caudoviricetes sp.]